MDSRLMIRYVLPPAVLFIIAVSAFAGGWAVITVKEFPDHAVAGHSLNLRFTVRQHGVTPLAGLRPTLRATAAGGSVIESAAVAGRETGEYLAVLTLKQPGDWRISINSGFNGSELTLPALKVVAATAGSPVPFSPMTRGLRLFTSKGCVGCHRHLEATPEPTAVAARMDLTGKRFPSEYLRKFLADPGMKTTDMPNLNLTPEEIEMLAMFINKDGKKLKQEAAR